MRFALLLSAWCMLWACTSTTTVNYPATEVMHSLSHHRLHEPAHCNDIKDRQSAFEQFTFAPDSIYAGFITRWYPPVEGADSCKALEQHLLVGCFTPDLVQIKKDLAHHKIKKATLEVVAFHQKVFPFALLKTTAWNNAVFQTMHHPISQQQATFQVNKVLSPWKPCDKIQFCHQSGLVPAPLTMPHRSKFSVPLKQPFQVDITKELKEMLASTSPAHTGFCITPTAPETHYQANNTIIGNFMVSFHLEWKK